MVSVNQNFLIRWLKVICNKFNCSTNAHFNFGCWASIPLLYCVKHKIIGENFIKIIDKGFVSNSYENRVFKE